MLLVFKRQTRHVVHFAFVTQEIGTKEGKAKSAEK